MRVRPPEPARRPRLASQSSFMVDEFANIPKKRGPKPKLRLRFDIDPDSCPNVPAKKSRLGEPAYSLFDTPRHYHHKEETSERSVIQLTRRFQEETTITQKASIAQGQVGTASHHSLSRDHGHPRTARPEYQSHRTNDCPGAKFIPHPKLKHLPKKYQHNSDSSNQEQSAIVARTPESTDVEPRSEMLWTPCLNNFERVVVTDVTTNFLTVTIKESSTDQGFFKDKR